MSKNKGILAIASSLEGGVIDKSVVDVALAMNERGFAVTVVSAGGRMVKELKKQGIEHVLLPVDSSDFFVVRRNLRKIQELAVSSGAALVHAFTPSSAFYAYRVSRALKLPYVSSFLKIYKKSFLRLESLRARYMVRGCFTIVPSEYMALYVQAAYRVPSERIIIVPQWIDTDVFNANNVSAERIISLASDLRVPEDNFIVASVAPMRRASGHATLLQAAALLPPERRGAAKFLVVGSYKNSAGYKSELENMARRLCVGDLFHFVGAASDIAALLMLCDVYVSTYAEPVASETGLLEAESLGRPIIASDIGASPEYMLDEESCRAFAPRDAEGLRDALLWAMDLSKEKRAKISARLASNVRLNFSRSTVPAKIGNIYDYVLDGKTDSK
jgi:glycosyltransferase involved in cell wall biosynthesis